MNMEAVTHAKGLAERLGNAILATAAPDGTPHVTAARSVDIDEQGRLRLSEWFCPGALANLEENSRVAVVVWDPERDVGLQMVGEVVEENVLAVLDGLGTESQEEKEPSAPSAERELVIEVGKVLAFSQAPHTDAETPSAAEG